MGGGGSRWTDRADRGRKRKNQYNQNSMEKRGDLLRGNDDLCQGCKGRQGEVVTKVCANND